MSQYVYNKHNTRFTVLRTVFTHSLFLYQKSHSFLNKTGKFSLCFQVVHKMIIGVLVNMSFLTVRSPFWVEIQATLVDSSVNVAVVGLTGWIISKPPTVKLPSFLLFSTAPLSLESPSFAVTGVLKYTTKETITLPSL